MSRVLVIEDSDADVREVVNLLRELNVSDVVIAPLAMSAVQTLEKIAAGTSPRPDLLIVDLALGVDSGYEVLRFWKSTPELSKIPVIVWTSVGGKVDEEICKHFHVQTFVQKQQGKLALQHAIGSLLAGEMKAASPLL